MKKILILFIFLIVSAFSLEQTSKGEPGGVLDIDELNVNGKINAMSYYQNGLPFGNGSWGISGTNIYNLNSGFVGIGTATPATKLDVNGITTSDNYISDVAIGTQPYACTSTTLNTNLNADLWDGYQFADYFNQALKTTSNVTFNNLTTTGVTYFSSAGFQFGSDLIFSSAYSQFIITDVNTGGAIALDLSLLGVGSPLVLYAPNANTYLAHSVSGTYAGIDTYINQAVKTTSSPTFANLIITAGGDIKPSVDSTTALSITPSSGADWITFDTTNLKIGFNDTTPFAYVELKAGNPVRGANTTDLLFADIRGTAVVRAGAFIAEKNNTVSDSNNTFSLNAFAYHYGTANLTATEFGLVGGRYGAFKTASGGTVSNARGVSSTVQFLDTYTGTITNAANFWAERIRAFDGIITNGYSFYAQAHDKDTGTFTNAYSIWLEKQTVGNTINAGIVLDGDGVGADLVLGDGQDVKIYYNGTDLVLDPDVVGTGKVNVSGSLQATDYYSGDGSQGITNSTSYWLCTAANCSTTCQVTIKNGLITGCS